MIERMDRIQFAAAQFTRLGIPFELKNPTTGHFHCWRKSDGKLFQFYATTGKIQGEPNKRGIAELLNMLLGAPGAYATAGKGWYRVRATTEWLIQADSEEDAQEHIAHMEPDYVTILDVTREG